MDDFIAWCGLTGHENPDDHISLYKYIRVITGDLEFDLRTGGPNLYESLEGVKMIQETIEAWIKSK